MDLLLEILSSKKDLPEDPWYSASLSHPDLSENEFGYPMSINVLGWFKSDNSYRVVYAHQDDDSAIEWRSACSEGWSVTDSITCWTYIVPPNFNFT